jgi:PIN domain nuclease of toxin-antitoxin system
VKYLLDSGIWLWSIDSVEKINSSGREILENGREEIYFSAASVWELSIKVRLGKLHLPSPPAQCIPAFSAKLGLKPLPVTQLHAVKTFDLEAHHSDPFDRLIISQAIDESMTILTSDRIFLKYPVELVWCGK